MLCPQRFGWLRLNSTTFCAVKIYERLYTFCYAFGPVSEAKSYTFWLRTSDICRWITFDLTTRFISVFFASVLRFEWRFAGTPGPPQAGACIAVSFNNLEKLLVQFAIFLRVWLGISVQLTRPKGDGVAVTKTHNG